MKWIQLSIFPPLLRYEFLAVASCCWVPALTQGPCLQPRGRGGRGKKSLGMPAHIQSSILNADFLVSAYHHRSVWICGHSIMHWASLYAAVPGWGTDHCLQEWKRHSCSQSTTIFDVGGGASRLMIQLGENGLVWRAGIEIVCQAESDLRALCREFGCIWSD